MLRLCIHTFNSLKSLAAVLLLSAAQELELVEDMWRGEVQDLLGQISRLQAENRRLTTSLPLKDPCVQEEDPLRQEGRLQARSWNNVHFASLSFCDDVQNEFLPPPLVCVSNIG